MKKIPILSFFGLTRELMQLQSYIHINDNTSALVEHIKAICECTDICVRLLTSGFEIELWGEGLTLTAYNEGCVEIRGRIEQVKLTSKSIKERQE